MNTHLIYATSNPGKVMEMSKHLGSLGVKVETMQNFDFPELDVPETGTSLGENAVIKVVAYSKALQSRPDLQGKKFLVLSDDTGLEIDVLGGKPGIHVRRWKGYRMSDEEIVEHALSVMAPFSEEQRGAQFRTVLAVGVVDKGHRDSDPKLFEGTLRGVVLEAPIGIPIEGFPFERLFYVPEWGIHLGGSHQLPAEEKGKLLSHRERAVTAAIPFIRKEMLL